jgi:CBS domain containing-hemolysin-like protein
MSLETQLLIALVTLLGNAFFVGAEFGLVSARRSNIELEALNGSRAARITLGAMEQVSVMLAGAQLGVTLCSLIFGAVGEPLLAHLLESPLEALGLSHVWLHPIAFVVALAVMVYLHVVIGEMVPKNLALAGPTRAALWLTPLLALIVKVARPAVHALNAIANGCVRLLGVKPRQEIASSFSRDEVAGFVKESHREGLLSKDEEQLLSGALSFDERDIRAVLLPLSKLTMVTATQTAEEIEALSAQTGYSRFPVKNSRGGLRGYVHVKDIIGVPADEQGQPLPRRYIRPLAEVRLTTSLRRALIIMQRSGSHLAQVVDKRGRPLGIIMLEDLLEELVGNIRDETQK